MNCYLKINWSIRSPLLLLSTLSKPAPPPYGFTTVADNNNLPLPLDHQIQFNFGELVGRQFCNFSKAFMDKLCCSGIDNPPCHSMAEGRNGSFQIIMMPTMTTAMHVFPGSHLCNVCEHLLFEVESGLGNLTRRKEVWSGLVCPIHPV